MENTKITSIYIKILKIVLIAIIFSISVPAITLAQYDYEYNSIIDGGGYDDFSNGFDYSYNPVIDGGYNQLSSGFDYSFNPSVNTLVNSGNNQLSSGFEYTFNPVVDTVVNTNNSQLSSGFDYTYNPVIDGGYNQLSSGFDYAYNPVIDGGYNQLSSGFDYAYNPVIDGGYDQLSSGFDYAYNPVIDGGYDYYNTASKGGVNYYDTVSSGGSNYYNTASNGGSNSQNGYNTNYNAGGYYAGGSFPSYYGNYGNVSSGHFAGAYPNPTVSSTYMPAASTITPANFSGGNYVDPYYQGSYYYSQPLGYNYSQLAYSQPTLTSNQVLAYTDTNPALDSVYLSDIPSTGFDDYYGILMFISLLVSWSAILAYIFLKRKIESQTKTAEACVGVAKVEETENSVKANLLNNIINDNSDISKVEEYARMYKVLLSSDASAKIVKLSRLGQISASEYIRGVATGEWTAIGESQVK